MEDLELMSPLEAHDTFSISMIQRICGFGCQRAADTVARLELVGWREDGSPKGRSTRIPGGLAHNSWPRLGRA